MRLDLPNRWILHCVALVLELLDMHLERPNRILLCVAMVLELLDMHLEHPNQWILYCVSTVLDF